MGKLSDAYDWATDKFWSIPGNKQIHQVISPDRPEDVTKSDAYKNVNDFASGLGDQRSNFSRTPTPTIVEGTAPPAGGNPGLATTAPAQHYSVGPANAAARGPGGPLNPDGTLKGSQPADPNAGKQYVDPTGSDAQKRALAMEEAAARGEVPSAAEQLFRKGIDEGMANQLGLAATLQGSNPGMALRAGQAGAANVATKSAADAAALRADEMAKARAAFAGTAGETRGQTIDLAKANQDAAIRQQIADNAFYLGLTDEQVKALTSMLTGAQQNAQNQNQYNLGQQQFWGSMFQSAAKGAGAGG